jgi:hypothetical protein
MYYILGEGGAKYGPADMDTLKQWVAEHRITRDMMIENADNGTQVKASDIPGLFQEVGETQADSQVVQEASPYDPLAGGSAAEAQQPTPGQSPDAVIQDEPAASPYSTPQSPYSSPSAPAGGYQTTNYPREAYAEASDDNYKKAWIFLAIGFFCCTFLMPVGLVYAYKARDDGHPQAKTVIIVGWVVVGLIVVGILINFATIAAMFASGGF